MILSIVVLTHQDIKISNKFFEKICLIWGVLFVRGIDPSYSSKN